MSADSSLWRAGWYNFAHHTPSPNFGPRPVGVRPDLVVIHSISLPPGVYGGNQVQAFFTNQLQTSEHPYFESLRDVKVSSHFYIRRGGELLQFVSCDDRAWHAGVSTHAGRDNCNDFSIGIELEGSDFEKFTDQQYQVLAKLTAALVVAHTLTDVRGHQHIAPGRKTDPWHFVDNGFFRK